MRVLLLSTGLQKFSTWYITRHYYVDIHPPLAKLAFAALLWYLGFQGAREDNVRWWCVKPWPCSRLLIGAGVDTRD